MEGTANELNISVDEDDLLDLGIGENEFEDEQMSEDELLREELLKNHPQVKQEPQVKQDEEIAMKPPCVSEATPDVKQVANDTSHQQGDDDEDMQYIHNNYVSYQNTWSQRRSEDMQSGRVDFRRLRKPLHVSHDSDPFVVGRELAYRLSEVKLRTFGHIVRVLGSDIAMEIFDETKRLVERGGLVTDDGQRKRTPGGTFLYLMRSRGYAEAAQIKDIFKEDNEKSKIDKKNKNKKKRSVDLGVIVNREAERKDKVKETSEEERLRRLSEESRRAVLTISTNENNPSVANGNSALSAAPISITPVISKVHSDVGNSAPIFVSSTVGTVVSSIVEKSGGCKQTLGIRNNVKEDEEDGEIWEE